MRKFRKISTMALAAAFSMSLFLSGSVSAEMASTLDESKKVEKIEVGTSPDKTAYVSGEEFSLEGGSIVVTYDDGTTAELPMTADCFSVKEPGMKSSGTKTVTIKCDKKSARFTVEVADSNFAVTYDQNYEGAPEAETVEVVKGQKAENTVPEREGYEFVGWYTDPDFTRAYDFEAEITGNVSLYALWKKTGAEYVDVTFDYGYYGKELSSYSYPTESGTGVAKPVNDPVREGYTFAGWVDEAGNAYDFDAAVTAPVTVTASWDKAVSGVQTYVFEAEDTNLSGKTGPAISGTANEIGMIVTSEGLGASNDRSVGYLYQYGNSLEFYIAADEDLTDVTLSISLSAEMEDLTLTPDTFGMYLNDEKLMYDTIEITDVPAFDAASYVAESVPFQYYLIGENLTLKKGANLVKLVTENNDAYTGTTMVAHAPLVDALKVETEGVVIWDENFGVPALDNYQH